MNIFTSCQRISWGVSSAVISILMLSAAAEAAIFSSVAGGFTANFEQPALENSLSTFTEALSLTTSGPAIATSEATAIFVSPQNEEAALELILLSEAISDGSNLFALAETKAGAAGLFLVDQGDTFSFDFSLSLQLFASVDNPSSESAFVVGNFLFSLFSQTLTAELNPEGFSFLTGIGFSVLLDTAGESVFLEPLIGEGVDFDINSFLIDDVGLDQAFIIDIQGSYTQTFEQPTLISLQQTHFDGIAIAQAVPAPSLLWGILSIGIIGIMRKGKQVFVKNNRKLVFYS